MSRKSSLGELIKFLGCPLGIGEYFRLCNAFKWAPVTMMWHVHRLQIEEWPPIW